MIKLNTSNAIKSSTINNFQDQVDKIVNKINKFDVKGFNYLGWRDLPDLYDKNEFEEILKTVNTFRDENIDTLVVISNNPCAISSKAAIDFVKGKYPIDSKFEIVYVGDNLSSSDLAQKLSYVENKNFAINFISKPNENVESLVAFRLFQKLLQKKVGEHNASNFIVFTTDLNHGELIKYAKENNYKIFAFPENISEHYSALTPAGLFPMAFAGLNISKILVGAQRANKKYSHHDLSTNDAFRYAIARILLARFKQVELLVEYEPQFESFNQWWEQLVASSEGKGEKGLFPSSAIYSSDLFSIGQFVQEGSKILFETVITVSTPNIDLPIRYEKNNFNLLNDFADMTLSEVNNKSFISTSDAHVVVGKVPNIHIEIDKMDEFHFGELITFFFHAISFSAYLMGNNPFNQSGVEIYKHNLNKQININK